MAEGEFAVAVISEPYKIPQNHPHWTGNRDKSVAITWRRTRNPLPCTPLKSAKHYAAIKWGDMILFGTYLPPSLDTRQFEEALEEMEDEIQQLGNSPIYVLGDFNAKATLWQTETTDIRGRSVVEWASHLGMCCLNHGGRSTCIRYMGESIVDLSFASPTAARRVASWKVSDRESKSDHSMTEVDIGEKIEETATRLQGTMVDACNTAMPKSEPRLQKAMPWWSAELDELRANLSIARRRLRRLRRRTYQDDEEFQIRMDEFRLARDTFGKAIRKAKAKAWEEFVLTLNEDPWGRPYKAVMKKLRRWTPPFTESLNSETLDRVLGRLFPGDLEDDWREPELPFEGEMAWRENLGVTQEELMLSAKKMKEKDAAPGPIGVPAKAWDVAATDMAKELRNTFSACLKKGSFPKMERGQTRVTQEA
ncbi:PREDICTED: uncharacterized protein LOC108770845 [Trachymyrmex cornetzi]|uniref:uncharacterized protein LOC108770845 n=1 Tax=Trachymyrmex cornetzi TaxID=471704 RepID=UPI00084F5D4B|nr:PREDICTED: uncharacterized protein LOC108770845 [Trachymyrmex cornetzi]